MIELSIFCPKTKELSLLVYANEFYDVFSCSIVPELSKCPKFEAVFFRGGG